MASVQWFGVVICGIRVSHDGGVAVIEGDRLVFCIELDKLDNSRRHRTLGDLDQVAEILRAQGLTPADIDRFVVDGSVPEPDSTEPARIATRVGGRPIELTIAPYEDRPGRTIPLARHRFRGHGFGSAAHEYVGYHHVDQHIMGGYCTSPFAARGQDALVLVGDGGSVGRLYHVVASARKVRSVATFRTDSSERSTLSSLVRQDASLPSKLVVTGESALDIKWNSRLRGMVEEIWIPPFPDDSGAAIGAACCEMFRKGRNPALRWGVYSGPRVRVCGVPDNWRRQLCDERGVAELLHRKGEPVVVLSGRAEIGPRALGNRSILAPATDSAMRERLNGIKRRAADRPVAAVCLAERAAEVFGPGGTDPYLTFEHRIRPEWADRIPAVQVAGTARVQTIDAAAKSATARILAAYEAISGIPVLCNTSANSEGCGFFPDVAAAARWGGARYIWSEGYLYTDQSRARQISRERGWLPRDWSQTIVTW
ncbi:carbamoyltransferase C-terminal domain-containing protein [Nocardia anaemiae]|uniref:carbamoyltransferase C-terminal domain-containing protein n=1 Tax=Nocardia anaemiae TaxID=263910 RepID=UPI000ADADFBC|nr:carbamoyltransferase C-terminal domain-containing protein [Nocardia anaemiae]